MSGRMEYTMFQLLTLFSFAPELLNSLIAALMQVIAIFVGAPPA